MDLGFESASDYSDEDEYDPFLLSCPKGFDQFEGGSEVKSLGMKSEKALVSHEHSMSKGKLNTSEAPSIFTQSKYIPKATERLSSGEDWDAECDEAAPAFVIPASALFDPYGEAAVSEKDELQDISEGIREIDSKTTKLKIRCSKTMNEPSTQNSSFSSVKSLTPSKESQRSRKEWLNEVESVYFEEKDSLLKELLNLSFESYHDPYDLVLYYATNAYFDMYSRRASIAKMSLETFLEWKRAKFFSMSGTKDVPSSGIKAFHQDLAMDFLISTGLNYADLISSIFELHNADKKSQAKKLGCLFDKGNKHKETAIIAGKLGLQNYFEPGEIIIPLLAFDKAQVIETYVSEDKTQQDNFLKIMDDLCSKSDEDIVEFISSKALKIVDKAKFKAKTLQKIAAKYVKKYNLDPVDYPHIFHTKNTQSLHLLLRKKYQERAAIGRESNKWDGLIEGAVVGSTEMQCQLVYLLATEYNDMDAALSWARWCDLPLEKLPIQCQRILKDEKLGHKSGSRNMATVTVIEQSNTKLQYETSADAFYNGSLSRDKIVFVDSPELLYKSLSKLFKMSSRIGFDAEWVPTYGRAGQQERIAILQLATEKEVFIIDLIALNSSSKGQGAIKELLEELLTSEDNLVIGYGISSDMRLLISNFSYSKELILHAKKFIDLCDLSQTIFSFPAVKNEFEKPASGDEKGLSLLVRQCLGKYLDKTYQVSNWEKRPLLEEQLKYAALDAYCLLELYEVLENVVQRLKLPVDMIPRLHVPGIHKPKERPSKSKNVQPELIIECIYPGPPRSPDCLKVVCDTMLQGLGRSLRCCGIDTVMLSNEEHHTKAVELSHKENRVILTKGRPFFKLRGYVRKDMIMDIPNVPTKDQISCILKRYNVVLRKRDIFSRCQHCNGNYYVKVSAEHMKMAYEIRTGNELLDSAPSPSPIDYQNLTINNGVGLRLEYLQRPQLNNVDFFYCCGTCGKIYWEGSHFGRKVEQFKDLLSLTESNQDESVYS